MNAAVWTLWLMLAAGENHGPVLEPLATFPTQGDCLIQIDTVRLEIAHKYGAKAVLPGLMFCVYGTPVKR